MSTCLKRVVDGVDGARRLALDGGQDRIVGVGDDGEVDGQAAGFGEDMRGGQGLP
jgi:hypothetical protein